MPRPFRARRVAFNMLTVLSEPATLTRVPPWMEERRINVVRVASEILAGYGHVGALAEILDQIEIALGIGDTESVIDWLDIGHALVE